MRKLIVIVIALVLIAGSVFGAKFLIDSKKAPEKKVTNDIKIVQTDTISNKSIPVIIPSNGNLRAKRRVELFAEVVGVFQNTGKLFRTGQKYRKGEIIIKIDNQEYYSQVLSARSDLNNQITALMADIRLDYPESYPQWKKYLDDWDPNSSTSKLPEPLDDKERYFITGRNIYTTYYNLKNQENRLSKFIIRAPFDGVLTDAMVSEGTLVRSGQQLGEFIQTGIYEITVAIRAEFADLLKVGEEVEMKNTSGSKTYIGKVTRINGKVDQATQTISTVIEVSDPNLKEGMYLSANLQAQKIDNAIEIDRNLLQADGQIFTVNGDKLKLTQTEPVFYTDGTVILKGLENGTVIISKTVPGAYEGMLVKTENSNETESTDKSAGQNEGAQP